MNLYTKTDLLKYIRYFYLFFIKFKEVNENILQEIQLEKESIFHLHFFGQFLTKICQIKDTAITLKKYFDSVIHSTEITSIYSIFYDSI